MCFDHFDFLVVLLSPPTNVYILEVFELKLTVICLSLKNWIRIDIRDSRIPILIIFNLAKTNPIQSLVGRLLVHLHKDLHHVRHQNT